MFLETAACLLLLAHPSTARAPARGGQDDAIQKTLFPGQVMRLSFDLVDLEGKTRTLLPLVRKDAPADAPKPPTSVVVFFSLYDPSCAVAVERLTEIQEAYRARNVEVVLVDSNDDEIVSGAGDPLEKFRKWRDEKKIALTVLIDRGNVAADRFGALCANQAFLIGADREVKYVGAIDDDPHEKKRAAGSEVRSYLRNALDAVLSGDLPEEASTRPLAGRPIKRASTTGVPK